MANEAELPIENSLIKEDSENINENNEFEVGEPESEQNEDNKLNKIKKDIIEPKEYKEEDAEPTSYYHKVVLQGLNKITARTSLLEANIGQATKFGNLEIIPRLCWKAAPEEKPENKVLLEIWEQKPEEAKTQIFHGWMFSSSPAISALEHAVYDITVIECKEEKL